jgi:ribonuclease VapC
MRRSGSGLKQKLKRPQKMDEGVVLDASAIMAALQFEKGGDAVFATRAARFVSTVNVAEVRTKLSDAGKSSIEIDEALKIINMIEVDFTSGQARLAGDLRMATRGAGLSVGDRACIALAAEKGVVAMTADKAWKKVELPVRLAMIR